MEREKTVKLRMATISDTEFHFWAEFQITLLHAYIAPQIQTSNWKAKKAIFVLFYNSKKKTFFCSFCLHEPKNSYHCAWTSADVMKIRKVFSYWILRFFSSLWQWYLHPNITQYNLYAIESNMKKVDFLFSFDGFYIFRSFFFLCIIFFHKHVAFCLQK